MHLVLDSYLAVHQLIFMVSEEEQQERAPEWQKLATARSRSEYVKGLAAFVGLDLMEYDTAVVKRSPKSHHMIVELYSRAAAERIRA